MKICCVIPLYNHAETVLTVIHGALAYVRDVLVVDDGSTDLPENFDEILREKNVRIVHHPVNLGKGQALRTAVSYLKQNGYDYMITMDADGQHHPSDLPSFLDAIRNNPNCFVVGLRNFDTPNVPQSSRIGRNISNFWCSLETGIPCEDTQSGFRAYPLAAVSMLDLHEEHYNFETEAFVKLIWNGFRLIEIPVSVTYQKSGKRISHFSPWLDTFRLSMLHFRLIFRKFIAVSYRCHVSEKTKAHIFWF